MPAIDQLRADLSQSKTGFDLTLKNAGYYAGWIPRGFVTAVINMRPDLLPGASLDKQTWLDGPYFREGLYYRPGITEWGARHIAARFDLRKNLEAANQDYSGTAEIGFGRFLGSAVDPMLILLVILLFTWIRKIVRKFRLKRNEIREMADAHQYAGIHPDFQPFPEYPQPQPIEVTDDPEEPPPAPATGEPPTTFATDRAPTPPPIDPTPARPPQRPTVALPESEPAPAPAPAPAPTVAPSKPSQPPGITSAPENKLFTAFQTHRAWAEKGSTDDQFLLANLYRQGSGVDASPEQASHWYRKAAEAGHAQAQYELAQRLFHGIGMLPDEHAAALWLQQAAQQGLVDAKINLATLYARGLGIAADPEQALHWLKSAAEDGDADADDLLATAYRMGWLGLDQDPEQSDFWQQRAIDDRD